MKRSLELVGFGLDASLNEDKPVISLCLEDIDQQLVLKLQKQTVK
ncbi:MAG: hypothetical protein V7K89_04245 [Nostoc sp.]